jgi:basic membrane protein A
MTMKHLIAVCAALMLLAPATVHSADKPLKVALVLPGPITDGTFNSAAYKGIELAKKKYALDVSMQENTPFAGMEEALLNYARAGYDVIIGHGFQFVDPAKKIHKRFPKTWFVVTMAKVSGEPNLASVDVRLGDIGYVAGALAALVSKTGVIGTVGGIPVPVIQEYTDGFARGAKRYRPDIEVLSAYVGSFTDAAKAKEITISMIERRADVVTAQGNESVMGTINAAKEAKIMAIGTFFDAHLAAPSTIVSTALVNMDVAIDLLLGKIVGGQIAPQNYLFGFREGVLGLAPYHGFDAKIPDDDKAKISALIADIKAGKVKDLPKLR